jgi:formyltetrahydrofolate deformylase
VKIIGATSHYVTSELDAGPIIEQDIVRIRHNDNVEDLKRKGQDNEKIVLSRAIRHHLQHEVLVYKNRCIVFD